MSNEMEIYKDVLKDILSRFESCIEGGNGELEDDADAINRARKLLGNNEPYKSELS